MTFMNISYSFRSGKKCECDQTSGISDVEYLERCKSNTRDTVVCSGHGTCL